jgi:calcium-activated chloride channel regulator 3/4
VDRTSGVYGDSPFTVQTGGCGDPGEYIQVSAQLLQQGNMEDIFGPPGQVFVHEWAKYRYGVFEEHGYPGDEQYPMFFIKKTWTVNGEENVLSPNFCLIGQVDYTLENINGGNCLFDELTGLPDSNCIFVLNNSSEVKSSIMALPYLEGNTEFCDDTETFYHDMMLPNKHNRLCNMKSTFSVILQHPDFQNYKPNNITSVSPKFELLLPKASSSYVMVLDVSGSMANYDRIRRMKDSAIRWVTYDVKDDVPIGIVQFSTNADILFGLTKVTNQTRTNVIEILQKLSAGGGTCLGAGLKKGLDTLKQGEVNHGGVMIFLTDGQQSCDGADTSDIPDVIDSVADQGVRVIAIAFGISADSRILQLAERTHGKAYFIPDGTGPEDINNALQGSLTFQPSVPSDQFDIVIAKETFNNMTDFNIPFIIDDTIGKNVTVQIDFSEIVNCTITIDSSNETFVSSGVYERHFNQLNTGKYSVSVISSSVMGPTSITVTSRSSENSLPIFTRCWTSAGTEQADLSKGTKIAVLAQVLQGNNPVVRAKVKAYIERDGVSSPIEIELYDQGAAPDNIRDDGIYSRYFTSFQNSADEVRYTLKCQVEGTDDSAINQGFLDAKKGKQNLSNGRSLPKKPSRDVPICCGSSTIKEDSILKPTGEFSRAQTGGMISIVNADQARYPPGIVNDLLTGGFDLSACTFSIMFTAPGAVLDSGTIDEYKIYFSNNQTEIMSANTFESFPYINETDLALGSANMTPVEAGTFVSLTIPIERFATTESPIQFFFRLEAAAGELRSASNTARLSMKRCVKVYQESGLTPGAITGIVLGTMLTVLVVVGASYWYKKKHTNSS